ncbi:sugar-transfer associated ATP-grasp domain-containing protein [Algibacter mikhailovii]|uniref:Alpha-L-glutamate ligase-related protein ATP-grasp domain-containing protein n=1 Tax=Algibacter mikhailovii TaxID=425498 RepID=A0A918V5F7_9FLAO|nr:sugar-transfer associated ATP-grasp domain-containing protein [Algibacter mikhailovii]GGZ70357.1 hypothetical protein GCM10007028_04330 [Algibacter mikhailovii]
MKKGIKDIANLTYLNSILIYSSLKAYNYFTKLSHAAKWKNKSKKLIDISAANKLSREQEDKIIGYYKNLGFGHINFNWHRFYTNSNKQFSVSYVPEDLFYMKIEPRLNKTNLTKALADKNLLDTIFKDIKQPKTVIKNINGFYYDCENLITKEIAHKKCENQKLIIKPTIEAGGGKNVNVFYTHNGDTDYKDFSIDKLFKNYDKDFIVQKIVKQHPKMKQLNSTSLNTFRVMSFLKGTSVQILSIVVRMGKEGSITDNSATGGIACGVNEDGTLNAIGFENNTGGAHTSTDAGIPFNQITLPFINEINTLVNKMHKKVPYFRLISWDLAVDESGQLVFVEYNIHGQGVNIHQLNNGPVLKDILEESSKIKD